MVLLYKMKEHNVFQIKMPLRGHCISEKMISFYIMDDLNVFKMEIEVSAPQIVILFYKMENINALQMEIDITDSQRMYHNYSNDKQR